MNTNEALQNAVLVYKENETNENFERVYEQAQNIFKYLTYKKSAHYNKTELLALCDDAFLKCLSAYRTDLETSFATYLSTGINNLFKNFYRDSQKSDNTLSLEAISEHTSVEGDTSNVLDNIVPPTHDDGSVSLIETHDVLSSIKKHLTENEYIICKSIIENDSIVSKADLARQLSLTKTGVAYLLKKVQQKFLDHGLVNL